jgi:hypothetical protein
VDRSTPPNADEFEISIIGPGRGECVLLHLGNNEWCIVDSCIASGRSESVASEYLSGFANGAVEGIRLVVATHWHDDHIRGIASILRQVPSAGFYCSAALDTAIFFELVGLVATGVQTQSGVDEFARILGLITERAGPSGRFPTPKWAIENRKLLHLPTNGRRFPVTVTALSPSDSTLALALAEISKLLPKTGDTQRRIPNLTPNHSSVALWIEVGPVRALLGADLLHSAHMGEGWTAVLANHQDPNLAAFFKVPHHGSENADCPDVWNRMLIENSIAVVTPFSSGTALPKKSDLRRLSERTTNLYCTAEGKGKTPRRENVVEKIMRRQVKARRVIEGRPGHVRVRWSLAAPAVPTIDLFNGAHLVKCDELAAP